MTMSCYESSFWTFLQTKNIRLLISYASCQINVSKLWHLFMARCFAVVCLFGLLFIWCKVHLQELEVFLLKFLHEQFQRNQLTANTPTDVYWEQIPQQSVFTAFYKFKGFGCGGFKNPFSQQKFCMQRKSASTKGRTAYNSPLCLGRVSPVLGPITFAFGGVCAGIFISFCLFVTWILLQ